MRKSYGRRDLIRVMVAIHMLAFVDTIEELYSLIGMVENFEMSGQV